MNPRKLHPYVLAENIKREQKSHDAWLQGLYIQQAIVSSFDSKHRAKYPDKPIRVTPLTEEEKRAKAIQEQQIVKANMMAWAKNMEKKLNSERKE